MDKMVVKTDLFVKVMTRHEWGGETKSPVFSSDSVIYVWGLCIPAAGGLCEGWGQQVGAVMKRKKYCMGTDSRQVKRGRPDAASDRVGDGDG